MYWNQARLYLSRKDKILSKIMRQYSGKLISRNDPFYSLCKSIVGQQVSVASADSVWLKLEYKCKKITPEKILQLSKNDLKKCGFSRQKIEYIQELANNFIKQKFDIKKLKYMNDNDAIEYLSKNKGIGRWSSEMFLLFIALPFSKSAAIFFLSLIGLSFIQKKLNYQRCSPRPVFLMGQFQS